MSVSAIETRTGEATTDPRDPFNRLSALFDAGTLISLHEPDGSNAQAARGRIDGVRAIAYCTDATSRGGAIGGAGGRHIAAAIDTAVRERCPVIGLWHSGGAQLAEGIESLDGIGRIFAAMIHASGKVPQISVVLGPAAGGAAYGPALTDLVIMAPEGRVFVTGPSVVRSVTGEDVDPEGLGGPAVHGAKSGVTHIVASSEADALDRARRITSLLAVPGLFDPRAVGDDRDLGAFLPDSPRLAYDVRPLVRGLLDEGTFEELQPKWAANMVVGLGRMAGGTVGVLANNPVRKGGCLDALSAEKAARFVRMCDSFGVPLVVLVDVPGYLPGVQQEWEGVVRRGAKLLYAFGEATVPRVTLVTRKSYGGAYIAMNSRALGASAVFGWPQAEIAVMGAEAAVKILHRRKLAAASEHERDELLTGLVAEHERTVGGPHRGVDLGLIDEIIEPESSRHRIVAALSASPNGSGGHGNIPL